MNKYTKFKKYNFILIASVFISLSCFAQEPALMAVYISSNSGYIDTGRLYVQKGNALYITDAIHEKGGVAASEDKNTENSIMLRTLRGTVPAKVLKQMLNSPVIQYTEYIGNKGYLITDTAPELKWQLIYGKGKQIGNYYCELATAVFRGAPIMAYYTTEIPVPFGPWKLKGLPGLILEAYIEDNPSYSWKVKRIVFPDTSGVPAFSNNTGLEKISLKAYLSKERESSIREIKKIQARAPADAVLGEITFKRTGPERVYEWEKK